MDNNSIISTVLARMEKHRFLYLDYGRYGLMVEPSERKDIDRVNQSVCFFVSVPSSSDLKNEDGEEMAAELLAETYAKALRSLFVKDLYKINKVSKMNLYTGTTDIEESVKKHVKVKYKIRNDHWTRKKEEIATATIMAVLMDRKNKV